MQCRNYKVQLVFLLELNLNKHKWVLEIKIKSDAGNAREIHLKVLTQKFPFTPEPFRTLASHSSQLCPYVRQELSDWRSFGEPQAWGWVAGTGGERAVEGKGEGREGEERARTDTAGQIFNWFLSLPVPASPAVSSAPENMINVYELAKLWFISKAEGFPSQRGWGTELMRSEAVGNEQKHANVKVIEHEYQTLTWEQSSFADGRSDQLPGGWLGAQTCIHCWLQNFHHNSLHFITLVTCFLS